MRRLRLIPLLSLGAILLLGLGSYLLSNTRLDLATAPDGSVTVETNFPNADCSKTLQRDFPFVHFECETSVSDGEAPPSKLR